MAVANQTPYKEYIGNGTTKIFPLEFDCDDADHLIVKVNDIEVPALNNWSLNTNTGSVVFAIAPITQSKIILQRDTPLVRDTDYQTYNNSLRPQPVNNDFDKIWLKLQELGVTNWLTDTDIKNLSVYVNSLNEETRDDFFYKLGNLEQNTNAMLQEAIKNGAVSALAIITVNTVQELNTLSKWDGRTVYVKDFANFKYSSANNAWLLSVDSAQSVALKNGKTIEEMSYEQIQGTNALNDSVTSGTLDTLLNSQVAGRVDLRKQKIVIPNGEYISTRWLRNRGTSATMDTSGLNNFSLIGQGSNSTILKHPGATGSGDHLYFDKAKSAKIGKFMLDNTALQEAGRNTNGQMWVTQSQDLEFEDIKFKGGYALSFALGNSKNIICKDLKVDFQYLYPVSTGKSPLIVGDFSQQCMFLGGYTKAVSDDGSVMYSGDLGDNDDATDTKWAFHNFYGLTYTQKSNANVCLWQEGERERSNMHAIGNNYVGNGFGRGISQLSLGTDVACSFNANQQAGIWARAQQWSSIGNHFLDIKNVKGLSTGARGAIWNESSDFMSTIGNIFKDNDVDYSNYGTGTYVYGKGYFSIGDSFSGEILQSGATTTKIQHQAWIGSRFDSTSTMYMAGTSVHNVVLGSQSKDFFGTFGNGTDTNSTQINDIAFTSFNADATKLTVEDGAKPAITQSGYTRINIFKSVFTSYKVGIGNYSGTERVFYEQCTFNNCTFSDNDLTYGKFINCVFIDCTNAPSDKGLNFKCDSAVRPSTIRTEVTLAAGGSYTFPSWTHEARGVYDISIGGRGANLPVYKGYAHKSSAASAATIVNTLESTVGAITVSWAANGYITITVTTAGTYSIKLG